jgi:NitT/TauT family transport system substrate-binding protein
MLQNGKIAAVTLPEPLASVAIKDGARLIDSSDNLKINPGIMMFTKKAAESKKNEIAAMYRAYNKAAAYLNSEPLENNIDLIIEKAGFPPAVKGALALPKYEAAALPSEKDVTECISWMNDRQLIKKNYKYDELVDGSFLK